MYRRNIILAMAVIIMAVAAGLFISSCEKQENPVGNTENQEFNGETGETLTPITKEQAYDVIISSGINPGEILFYDIAPYDSSGNGDCFMAWTAVVSRDQRLLGTFVDVNYGMLLAQLTPLQEGLAARLSELGIGQGGMHTAGINQYNSFPWNWHLPFIGSAYVTQGYGGAGSSYVTHTGSIYYAIDVSGGGAANGQPIKASCSGWVMFATQASGANWQYGKQVILEAGPTGQPNSNRYMVRFAHMSSISVVAGWWVERGTVLGYVGSTGQSTGAHIHWNINRGGYAGYGGIWGDSFPPSWPPGVDDYNGSYNCWITSNF